MKKTTKENMTFTEVTELYGHKTFREFEKEHDDLIIYADGDKKSVINELLEPIDYKQNISTFEAIGNVKLYVFDGWFIAIK